jgi:hypothetical protein
MTCLRTHSEWAAWPGWAPCLLTPNPRCLTFLLHPLHCDPLSPHCHLALIPGSQAKPTSPQCHSVPLWAPSSFGKEQAESGLGEGGRIKTQSHVPHTQLAAQAQPWGFTLLLCLLFWRNANFPLSWGPGKNNCGLNSPETKDVRANKPQLDSVG